MLYFGHYEFDFIPLYINCRQRPVMPYDDVKLCINNNKSITVCIICVCIECTENSRKNILYILVKEKKYTKEPDGPKKEPEGSQKNHKKNKKAKGKKKPEWPNRKKIMKRKRAEMAKKNQWVKKNNNNNNKRA